MMLLDIRWELIAEGNEVLIVLCSHLTTLHTTPSTSQSTCPSRETAITDHLCIQRSFLNRLSSFLLI